jgi:hypothetical protein
MSLEPAGDGHNGNLIVRGKAGNGEPVSMVEPSEFPAGRDGLGAAAFAKRDLFSPQPQPHR